MIILHNNWLGTFALLFTVDIAGTYGFSIGSLLNGRRQEPGPRPLLRYYKSEWLSDDQATQGGPVADLVNRLLKSNFEVRDNDYDTSSPYSDVLDKATQEKDYYLEQSEQPPGGVDRKITPSKRMDMSKLIKDCQKGHQFGLWHRALCRKLMQP
ncbi:uncharacterized protein LOC123535619 [Mercenaria mercenaria]|uniref:uncharacterized protein LOC123535619 n=1 Tax=Mercenaria mercenaria TaxID=6596 RepID=UPI00234EDFB8|nr:uncharacterized protein LOC123535619 [Mercenaria mercenaria]